MTIRGILKKKGVAMAALALLAGTCLQAAVVVYQGNSLETLIDSGMTNTVNSGDLHKLVLADGSFLTVAGGSSYQVVNSGGSVRVILQSGQVAFTPVVPATAGSSAEVEVNGTVIASSGAELIVESSDAGISIGQTTTTGTVSVGGVPIPAGKGGIVEDGAFTPEASTEGQLMGEYNRLIRETGRRGPPNKAFEKMKDFPREIVEENLNDVSPS